MKKKIVNEENGTVKKDKTLTRKETKNLPCKLTEMEILAYGRDLASKHAEYSRIEAQFTAMKTEYKGKLEEVDARISTLSNRIQSGEEYRDIETIETKNWTTLTVITERTDTGEVLETRPMREDEKQQELLTEDDKNQPERFSENDTEKGAEPK